MSSLQLDAVTRPQPGRRSRNGDATTTMASTLTARLRNDIIRGRLAPGSKLKIKDLAEAYGVGTIPLREALSRLTTSGFLDFEDQKGFRVRPVSQAELQDLTRVRLLVEKEALRDAIAHADLDWEERIVGALHRMSRLPIVQPERGATLNTDWESAHDDFHRQLLSNCSSAWLKGFADTLRDQTTRYRHLTVGASAGPQRNVPGEHKAIVDAILARDADAACRVLEQHLQRTTELALTHSNTEPGFVAS